MTTYKELADRLTRVGHYVGSYDAIDEAAAILRSLDEQKPAAWWYPKGEQFALAKEDGSRPFAKVWEPLYAAPVAAQASKPLSDDETDEILDRERIKWNTSPPTYDFSRAFARAIVAAFCQKNGIKGRG